MKKTKKAFTLVELLIAMFIFAMLAVLLVPNVANTAEKELFATQVKKVQNDIQQAMLLMMSKNQGSLQSFCVGVGNGGECFTKEIGKRLEKKAEYDQTNIGAVYDPEACAADGAVNDINEIKCYQAVSYVLRKPQTIHKTAVTTNTHPANRAADFYVVNLANGAAVSTVFNSACNFENANDLDNNLTSFPNAAGNYHVCGYMEVDVNAGKAPNMVGKDIHYFWIIDRDGIVPFGEIDGFTCQNVKTTDNVFGCTARLLRDGKINYY